MRDLHTKEKTVYDLAAELHDALLNLYLEELNGRLCPMPESEDSPGTCKTCRGHWKRARSAIDAYEEFKERSIA